MVGFKKFLFDNFVVGEENSSHPDGTFEPIDDFEKEEAFETLKDDIKDIDENLEVEQPKENETFASKEENSVLQERTKLADEYEEKIKKAREEGYQEGFSVCRDSTEAMSLEVLKKIEQNLKIIFSDLDERVKNVEGSCVEVLAVGLRKIVPNLLAENATEIVSGFLKQNFENIKKEPKLSFYIHPNVISSVQNEIAELARVNDFEGKISLHKDASLQTSDCRIEWENGGVERRGDEILDKVENFLGSNK